MAVPTTHELSELAARVRQLEEERDIAHSMRDTSSEGFLQHQIALKRWAMAHTHLGERIREYIESGASGVVRP